ncbi:hypothetical protein ABKN59_006869 [Abortiporus biennis]
MCACKLRVGCPNTCTSIHHACIPKKAPHEGFNNHKKHWNEPYTALVRSKAIHGSAIMRYDQSGEVGSGEFAVVYLKWLPRSNVHWHYSTQDTINQSPSSNDPFVSMDDPDKRPCQFPYDFQPFFSEENSANLPRDAGYRDNKLSIYCRRPKEDLKMLHLSSIQPPRTPGDNRRLPLPSPLRTSTTSFWVDIPSEFRVLLVQHGHKFTEAQNERSKGEKIREETFTSFLNSLREDFTRGAQQRSEEFKQVVIKHDDVLTAEQLERRKTFEKSMRTWKDNLDQSFNAREEVIDQLAKDIQTDHRHLSNAFSAPYHSLERSFEELLQSLRADVEKKQDEWGIELGDLTDRGKSAASSQAVIDEAKNTAVATTPTMRGPVQAPVLSRPHHPPSIPLRRTESPLSEELNTPFDEMDEISPPVQSSPPSTLLPSTSPDELLHGNTSSTSPHFSSFGTMRTGNVSPSNQHDDKFEHLLVGYNEEFAAELSKWKSLFINTEKHRTITIPAQRTTQFQVLQKELHTRFNEEMERFGAQIKEKRKSREAYDTAFEQEYTTTTDDERRRFQEQMGRLRMLFLSSSNFKGNILLVHQGQANEIFERIDGQLRLAIQEQQDIFEKWRLYWNQRLKPFIKKTSPLRRPRLTTRGSSRGNTNLKLEPESSLSLSSAVRTVGSAARTIGGAVRSATLNIHMPHSPSRDTTHLNSQPFNIPQNPNDLFNETRRDWCNTFEQMMEEHDNIFEKQESERKIAFQRMLSKFMESKESMERKSRTTFETQMKIWDGELSWEVENRKVIFERRMVEWEIQLESEEKKREGEFSYALRKSNEAAEVDDIRMQADFERWKMEVNLKAERMKQQWKKEFARLSTAQDEVVTEFWLDFVEPLDSAEEE